MKVKQKYYVVWQGKQPGVYSVWKDCEAQIRGVAGAMFKSYASEAEARQAYAAGPPDDYYRPKAGKASRQASAGSAQGAAQRPEIKDAVAVDAACSKNPGPMEYQCVDIPSGARIFHFGPIQGTNNIGEFLAIVHALSLLQRQGNDHTAIYSDSRNALLWVKARKCRTRLAETPQTRPVLDLVRRAEAWLATHTYPNQVLKWPTEKWGEIPADFGRKR